MSRSRSSRRPARAACRARSDACDTPTAAARVARDGDAVLIEAADYRTVARVWPQNRLLLRGVDGRPHLIAGEPTRAGQGDLGHQRRRRASSRTSSSQARSPRATTGPASARRAVVSPCAPRYFHDSDMGLLSSNDPEQEITVEYSEFARNGHEDGKAHNLYIGSIRRFELRFSSSHGARIGHLRQEPREAEPDRLQPSRRRAGRDPRATSWTSRAAPTPP